MVWPSLVATFGSVTELKHVAPGWFVVMAACEVLSYACMWLLIGLCLGSSRYFAIGTAQVVGNAVSKVVPGGSPMGAAMQYRMLVGAGMDPARIGTGTAAASLINVATLFALPVLAVPAIVGGVAVDRGLARAAWLGVAVFVLLVGGGAVLLLLDKPIGAVAHTIERIHNAAAAPSPEDDRPRRSGSPRERDAVRATLGEQWGQAILRSAGNVLFDYLALLAALVASGARPTRVARAPRLRRVGRPRHDPDHAGRPRVRRGGARRDAGPRGGARPRGDLGDARLSAGVVLGADPRRPGRVRAVPTPGSAVAGGGARPGRYLSAARPSAASSCSCGVCGWWWPGRPSGVSSFS